LPLRGKWIFIYLLAVTTAASMGARKLTRPGNQGIIVFGKFEILVLDHEKFPP
jgi:hypothetical protein